MGGNRVLGLGKDGQQWGSHGWLHSFDPWAGLQRLLSGSEQEFPAQLDPGLGCCPAIPAPCWLG